MQSQIPTSSVCTLENYDQIFSLTAASELDLQKVVLSEVPSYQQALLVSVGTA